MYKFLFITCLFFAVSASAQYTVRGTVLDQLAAPIPGAFVKIKNEAQGTTTNENGEFMLEVASETTLLEISFIGFSTMELMAKNASQVTLIDQIDQLDEVVAIGYTSRKGKALTGSVSYIKADLLKQPVANMAQMIQGHSAGVSVISESGMPGASSSMNIRGSGSIKANRNPLYIMDGMTIDPTDFNRINPADIESLTILKDASSTAIYGSRGANGVLLITTKRGKSGKSEVSARSEYGFSYLIKPNFDLMNTPQKIAYEIATGLLDPIKDAEKIKSYQQHDFDQFDEIFRVAKMQNHEVSVRGGSQNTKIFLSFGYYDQKGVVQKTGMSRLSSRVNIDHKLNNWIEIGTSLNLAYSSSMLQPTPDAESNMANNALNPVRMSVRLNPYEQIKDANGKYHKHLNTYFNSVNPMYEMELNDFLNRTYSLTDNMYLKLNFGSNFSYKTSLSVIVKETKDKIYYDPESYWGSFGGTQSGYLQNGSGMRFNYVYNNQLDYRKSIDLHHFSSALGTEYSRNKSESISVAAKDPAHPYFKELSEYNAIVPDSWAGGSQELAIMSFYGFAHYEYNNKYFADLSLRVDGDSRFGKNNKWAQFWSLGLQWNLKQESFMANVAQISMLKVRGSVGTQGNSGIGNYLSYGLYNISSLNYDLKPASYAASLQNDALTWEKSRSYNLGVDLGLWNQRVRIITDIYSKKTFDMLMDVPITLTSGLGSRVENAAAMRNQGVELEVSFDLIRQKHVQFNVSANIGLNQNSVLKVNNYQREISDGDKRILKEGVPFGTFYMVRWAGVNPANGDPLWYDKDGNVTNEYRDSDRVIFHGKSFTPNKTAGLRLEGSYKGWGINAHFASIWDKWVINNNLFYLLYDNATFRQDQHLVNAIDFWQKPGDITQLPRISSPGKSAFTPLNDSRQLQDQSFVRLRNVSFSYTFPASVLKSQWLKGLQVYASGQNLWTWTNYEGFNPENPYDSDLNTYPASRTFTFGINFKL